MGGMSTELPRMGAGAWRAGVALVCAVVLSSTACLPEDPNEVTQSYLQTDDPDSDGPSEISERPDQVAVAPVAPPALACGADRDFEPNPGLIPGGKWGPSFHTGTSTQAALLRTIEALAANIYYRCTRRCADGSAAQNHQCRATVDVTSANPLSENPADWGAQAGEWTVRKLSNGRYLLKSTIRRFPVGADGKPTFTVTQKCKKC